MLWICIIIAIASLFVFWRFWPRYVLISLPITLVVDLICFWEFFSYYESRPLMILFVVFQLGFQAIFALHIRRESLKENDNALN